MMNFNFWLSGFDFFIQISLDLYYSEQMIRYNDKNKCLDEDRCV